MPRSPCPPNQTRNRSTKLCRDKLKRGRKPGTRKALPVLKEMKFTVDLDYQDDDDEEDMPVHIDDHSKKIIKWYSQFINDPIFAHLKIKAVKHVADDEFVVLYAGAKDELMLEMFVDPDDDGNYPLTIHNQTYLVSGVLEDD
jgi:hypothetical protein